LRGLIPETALQRTTPRKRPPGCRAPRTGRACTLSALPACLFDLPVSERKIAVPVLQIRGHDVLRALQHRVLCFRESGQRKSASEEPNVFDRRLVSGAAADAEELTPNSAGGPACGGVRTRRVHKARYLMLGGFCGQAAAFRAEEPIRRKLQALADEEEFQHPLE